MKTNDFLRTEDGIRNSERFIKAVKERRLFCVVNKVSASGMSRTLSFYEHTVNERNEGCILNFFYLLKGLGYRVSRTHCNGIIIGGCGMDMVWHTVDSVLSTLNANGFEHGLNHTPETTTL